ncbi:hypothetical protein [Halorientalis halophila]|uniref:hypothetical protein n=1 Tax=Halorientalis halophila TaxID=3108499 RepID=UPI00300B60C9
MDFKRAAAACFVLAFAFFFLGSITASGFISRTARACTVVGDPRFLGLDWERFAVVVTDGCNRTSLPAFNALGGLSVIAAAAFGVLAIVRRIR